MIRSFSFVIETFSRYHSSTTTTKVNNLFFAFVYYQLNSFKDLLLLDKFHLHHLHQQRSENLVHLHHNNLHPQIKIHVIEGLHHLVHHHHRHRNRKDWNVLSFLFCNKLKQ